MRLIKTFLEKIIYVIIGICIVACTYTVYAALNKDNQVTQSEWDELVDSIVPSGAVMAFNANNCPSGWRIADGNESSPDLRGVFVRGLDSEKGIDPGRVLNTFQDSQNLSHGHSYLDQQNTCNSEDNGTNNSSGFCRAPGRTDVTRTTVANGGGEARPKNIALLYCYKL